MARSVDDILAQVERFIPPEWRVQLRPLLAGRAAQMREAELLSEDCATSATVGGAEDDWLTLLALGHGVRRSTSEIDASLRERLRNPADALTKPAILDAVNAILAAYGSSDEAVMIEHWRDGLFFDDFYAGDDATIADEHNAFTLIVPEIDEFPTGLYFFDDEVYLDDEDAWLSGGTGESAVYAAIVALVNQMRAAGVRWWLFIDTTP
jgi:hypothetical protein